MTRCRRMQSTAHTCILKDFVIYKRLLYYAYSFKIRFMRPFFWTIWRYVVLRQEAIQKIAEHFEVTDFRDRCDFFEFRFGHVEQRRYVLLEQNQKIAALNWISSFYPALHESVEVIFRVKSGDARIIMYSRIPAKILRIDVQNSSSRNGSRSGSSKMKKFLVQLKPDISMNF